MAVTSAITNEAVDDLAKTNEAVDDLAKTEGDEVIAVIKVSHVMLAK